MSPAAGGRGLPDAAYAAALASVAGIGPARLRGLLEGTPPPAAWASVVAGRDDDPGGAWRDQSRRLDVATVWDTHRRLGIDVLVPGDDRYPAALASDPEAPAVLFALGDPSLVDRYPRVAVVGTRTSTRYGLGVAAQLGADLATAGVAVLSGLALGIDGAAHEGALAGWHAAHEAAAPPFGVVAVGLDAPYPRRHALLWRRVAEEGVILSESPAGAAVPRWRFPQRNRVLAALADVVVVVECHVQGGSLYTVRAAARRGVSVGAVPGSVRSPASAGANDLLADGCFVVRDASDVLVAVSMARAGAVPVRARRRRDGGRAATGDAGRPPLSPVPSPTVGAVIAAAVAGAGGTGHDAEAAAGPHGGGGAGAGGDPGPDPDPEPGAGAGADGDPGADGDDPGADPDGAVLQALDWEPCSVEQVLRRTGLPLATASVSLERLRRQGRIRGDAGWWGRV